MGTWFSPFTTIGTISTSFSKALYTYSASFSVKHILSASGIFLGGSPFEGNNLVLLLPFRCLTFDSSFLEPHLVQALQPPPGFPPGFAWRRNTWAVGCSTFGR